MRAERPTALEERAAHRMRRRARILQVISNTLFIDDLEYLSHAPVRFTREAEFLLSTLAKAKMLPLRTFVAVYAADSPFPLSYNIALFSSIAPLEEDAAYKLREVIQGMRIPKRYTPNKKEIRDLPLPILYGGSKRNRYIPPAFLVFDRQKRAGVEATFVHLQNVSPATAFYVLQNEAKRVLEGRLF